MDDKPLPLGWVIALRLFFGGVPAVPGLLLIASSLGITDAIPWATRIPVWGAILVGLPFVAMGAMIALGFQNFGDEDTSVPAGVKLVLLLSFLVPMALIFLWAGFGPGEREFTVTTTVGSTETTGPGNELIGRCVFGGGGIFMTIVILAFVRNYFKNRGR
ncbi:MAG: hypothetical protein AB1649_31760 [Chloroflexota bacterium]